MKAEDTFTMILRRLEQLEAKLYSLSVEDAAQYLDIGKACREQIYFKRTEIHDWAFSRRVRMVDQLRRRGQPWLQ